MIIKASAKCLWSVCFSAHPVRSDAQLLSLRSGQECDLIQDRVDGEIGQAVRMAQDEHLLAGRAPDFFFGFTPENESGQADCGREVRNTGVMSDKTGALL